MWGTISSLLDVLSSSPRINCPLPALNPLPNSNLLLNLFLWPLPRQVLVGIFLDTHGQCLPHPNFTHSQPHRCHTTMAMDHRLHITVQLALDGLIINSHRPLLLPDRLVSVRCKVNRSLHLAASSHHQLLQFKSLHRLQWPHR